MVGYSAMLKNKKDIENENRLENIKEFKCDEEFDNLESFLEHVSLATWLIKTDGEKVNMMTRAKGLEWFSFLVESLFQIKNIEKGRASEKKEVSLRGITEKKMPRFLFQWIDFIKGWIDDGFRFIDELPEEFIEKNSFFDGNNDNDFNLIRIWYDDNKGPVGYVIKKN